MGGSILFVFGRPRLAAALGVLAAIGAAAACSSSQAANEPTASSQPAAVRPSGPPPRPPTKLTLAGATPTTLSVRWSAPGRGRPAAYALYRNGAPVAKTRRLTHAFAGLTCAVRYTLSVYAVDAAGRRSAPITVSAATKSCPNRAASVFVAPGASDSAACSQADPCGSFDRAYHLARPGQAVELATGTYPQQRISPDSSKRAFDDVVLRPAAGAAVAVDALDVAGAAHVEFRDLTITNGWQVLQGSSDVTFRNVTTASLYVVSASDVNVLGGSAGPQTNADGGQIKPGCPGCPRSTRILLDGVFFHDAVLAPGSDAHVECLQIWGTRYLTIRSSRFVNCETHDVFFSGEGEAVRDVTFENNMGGTVRSGFYSFRIAAKAANEGCENVEYRYNSATTTMVVECGPSASGVRLVGNLGRYDQWNCDRRFAYRHNVWDGAKCGGTDVNSPSGFRDGAGFDLHLAAGSAAIDRGDPRDYPPVDIDGAARPAGRAPDAGADERT